MISCYQEPISGTSGTFTFQPDGTVEIVSMQLLQSAPLSSAHSIAISLDGSNFTTLLSTTAIPSPLALGIPAGYRQPVTISWTLGFGAVALAIGLRHGC